MVGRLYSDSRLKKIRKIDGELWHISGTRYSKEEAEREANRMRKSGWKARVVELSYKYAIYLRK